ncbi:unnamed protein product, partial [Phaeothamnion confervicola]
MGLALRFAAKAYKVGEVPVGAVLVDQDGIVLATGHNSVESLSDATAHAEIVCMREAARLLGTWRLAGTTLYTTVEPCAMCLSAVQMFRVVRVVYGAPDHRLGAAGSWFNLLEHTHPFHPVTVRGGVLAGQSAAMMRRFFRSRR